MLTTFSVSWIRRRAEGEGKFVSLERLRLLSLENLRMRKSQAMILKVRIRMRILWTILYLDMVLLAEEKPDEEDVRLPSPGLGIILIFCSIP